MTFFDRGDYRMTRVALVATAAVYPLLTVPWRIAGWVGGGPLVHLSRIPGPVGPVITDPTVRPGVEVRHSDEVVWTIADATAGQWLAILALSAVPGTPASQPSALAGSRSRQARPRSAGVPGTADRARPRLRVSGPGLSFALDLATLLPFLAGTVVLVLAESFRVGDRLRSDVEGLV